MNRRQNGIETSMVCYGVAVRGTSPPRDASVLNGPQDRDLVEASSDTPYEHTCDEGLKAGAVFIAQ
jgi:hypothetical protein